MEEPTNLLNLSLTLGRSIAFLPPPPPLPLPPLFLFNLRDDDHDHNHNNNVYVYPPEQSRERIWGPLELELYIQDPWKINKILTASDVNDLCRLMLRKTTVEEHILSLWDEEGRRAVMEGDRGVRVDVWDVNTRTMHQLVFKRWKSSACFVFTSNWVTKFVERRRLIAGDEIGLYWNRQDSSFYFRVISWAPRTPPYRFLTPKLEPA